MGLAWGIVLVLLAALAWAGQTMAWLAPAWAERRGLTEPEAEVEPVFWADSRGEAAWDALTLWTLLVAGILLIADSSTWAYFGLVGGGIYAYFGGRGIFARMSMQRRGYRIGTTSNVTIGYAFLATWLVAGLVTIVAAVVAL